MSLSGRQSFISHETSCLRPNAAIMRTVSVSALSVAAVHYNLWRRWTCGNNAIKNVIATVHTKGVGLTAGH